ncbi:MAG: hypothetical protein EXS52_01305 [Candidatus Staskawiczbacteria bacterium]|nr:hypothetical protein [Candidatus Staskawiczbacteria bacterium]
MINLLDGEKILSMKRRHWFVIALDAVYLIMLGVLPFVGMCAVYILFPESNESLQENASFITFYGLAWITFLWMFFFINWTNYYLDTFLITNKRIIYIEQVRLFRRNASELRLEKIQDIQVKILGIVPSLLNMGDLHIQTAGGKDEVVFKSVPNAHGVKNMISKCCDEALKVNSAPTAPAAPASVPTM